MEHDKDSDETRVVPNAGLLFLPPTTCKLTSPKKLYKESPAVTKYNMVKIVHNPPLITKRMIL